MNVANAIYVGINPVVPDELREDWEYYSNFHPDANWYSDGREYQRQQGIDDFDRRAQIATNDPNLDLSSRIATHIYDYDGQDSGIAKISPRDREYLPVWQVRLKISSESPPLLSCSSPCDLLSSIH